MNRFGTSHPSTSFAHVPSAPADGAPGGGYNAIFGDAGDDDRARLLAASWGTLLTELRGPVEAILRGGLSAGDIAYRLGELVHGFYRTRGVTLASYELRRLVVALLDCHRRGWPDLRATLPGAPAVGVRPASVAPESDALVAFVSRDAHRPPLGGWNTDLSAVSPHAVSVDLPSSLVSREAPTNGSSASIGPSGAADRAVSTPASNMPTPHGTTTASDASGLDSRVRPHAPAVATVGVDVALTRILPMLRRQSGGAPGLAAPRHEVMQWLRDAIGSAMAAAKLTVADEDTVRLERAAFDTVFELGPLDSMMGDTTVAGVFVDGPDAVFVERAGRLELAPVAFSDTRQLGDVADRMLDRFGGVANGGRESLIDRHLQDGTRLTVVVPPVAPRGPHLAIRRVVTPPRTLEALVAEGMLSPPMADLLRLAVRDRVNVMACGSTGSGTTALLSALARDAPAAERTISVVPSGATLPDLPGRLALIASGGGVTPARALAAALALRPDRLVIDDVDDRAMAGIVDAAAGGHDGVFVGVTAASVSVAMARWEAAVRAARTTVTSAAARRRVARAFPIVAQLERRGGVSRMTRLGEMPDDGDAAMYRDLFSFDERAGRFIASGLRPTLTARTSRVDGAGPPDDVR